MSVLYDITLRISYQYDGPAASNRTLLRMLPRSGATQQLISGVVESDPRPDSRRDGTDFFGNPTTEVAHDAPLSELGFCFTGRVRRDQPAGALDLSCGLRDLAREVGAVSDLGPGSPHHFLGASDRVRPEPEIAEFARGVTNDGMSARAAVEAVSRALHAEFTFDPGATEVKTEPIESFRNRRGVCQDISHVMIAALREIGVPAGYVSGFLRTIPPEGAARLEGADAMHAWVRAWCGAETGWVEIDPTNDMRVGTDHVVVALGRDYSDVAPVRGAMRVSGAQRTTHQVDVTPV